jgi:hypothetical protein
MKGTGGGTIELRNKWTAKNRKCNSNEVKKIEKSQEN